MRMPASVFLMTPEQSRQWVLEQSAKLDREAELESAYLDAARGWLDRADWPEFGRRLELQLVVAGRTRRVILCATDPEKTIPGTVLVCNGRRTVMGLIRRAKVGP